MATTNTLFYGTNREAQRTLTRCAMEDHPELWDAAIYNLDAPDWLPCGSSFAFESLGQVYTSGTITTR